MILLTAELFSFKSIVLTLISVLDMVKLGTLMRRNQVIMDDYKNIMLFEYKLKFEKTEKGYRLVSYNSPWENCERELEDIRLIFEGKDLKDNKFPAYKVIAWENLKMGEYDSVVEMRFIKNPNPNTGYDQLFKVLTLKEACTNE